MPNENGWNAGIDISKIDFDANETIQIPDTPPLLAIVSWVKDNTTVGRFDRSYVSKVLHD